MAEPRQGEHERFIPWWPLGGAVALVAALLIGLLVMMPFYGRMEYQTGVYDLTKPVTVVHYHGQAWIPRGASIHRPDVQMAAVGQTDEGNFLYVAGPSDLQGGGGGPPALNDASVPGGKVYLRTGAQTYVPLERR